MKKIVVFGLGAAGSNIVLNIIRDIPELEIIGIDFDKVEPRNYTVGTQPYLKQHVNKLKTQALQMVVLQQANTSIITVNKKIENLGDVEYIIKNYANNSSLIIDCFDSPESKNLLYNYGKLKQTDVLHIGFSHALTGEAAWNEVWTEMLKGNTNIDICTQQGARSFIMSLTSLASLVIVDYVRNGIKTNIFFDKRLSIKKF
jgi:hypothetical protein